MSAHAVSVVSLANCHTLFWDISHTLKRHCFIVLFSPSWIINIFWAGWSVFLYNSLHCVRSQVNISRTVSLIPQKASFLQEPPPPRENEGKLPCTVHKHRAVRMAPQKDAGGRGRGSLHQPCPWKEAPTCHRELQHHPSLRHLLEEKRHTQNRVQHSTGSNKCEGLFQPRKNRQIQTPPLLCLITVKL